jgi:imidazolonepropionase-like amidohydrolase
MRARHAPTVFVVGTLVDGTGRDPIQGAAVVVEDGKILKVGPINSVGFDRERYRVVDAGGATLIPGLVDMHSHVFYVGSEEFEPAGVKHIARGIKNAGTILMQGVTTARDVCTRDNLDVEMRDAVNCGLVHGPRFFVSGKGMAMTGGKATGYDKLVTEITGANEARRFVRNQLRAGVDLIKVFATAGLTDGGQEQLTEEEIRAAVEEAHKAGRHVAAHAIGTEGIKNALRAGVDTLEHGTFLDEEAIALMADKRTALIPTLAVGETMVARGDEMKLPRSLVENARQALDSERSGARMAHEAGVPIAAGTDPVYGDTIAMEWKALLQIGLTPMEALQAATIVAARILGRGHLFGTVESGKTADLVLLDGNPLADVSALERVRYVVKEGAIVSPSQPFEGTDQP